MVIAHPTDERSVSDAFRAYVILWRQGLVAPGIQQHMGELTFTILAISVAILVWVHALRLLQW
jgi:hypothetical protein